MKVIDIVKFIIGNNNDILMSYFDIEYKRGKNDQPILDTVEVTSNQDELQILLEHLTFMSMDKDYMSKLVKGAMENLQDAPKEFEGILNMLVNNTYIRVFKTAMKQYKKLNKEEFENGTIN